MASTSFAKIIESEQPVLVDFSAEWCGPCKMMHPILQDLKKRLGDKVKIVKIDIDKNPNLAQQYQVQGVPTLMIFKDSKLVWRESGVRPVHELEKQVLAAS